MALKLTTTRKVDKYVNVLCYGESGIGKTHMIQTAPRPLLISAESGALTLAEAENEIPMYEINTKDDCNEVFEMLSNGGERVSKYNTICIDSLSEIAEVLLSTELENTKDPRQAYGVMNSEMAILIRAFRDLPFHTYFTAKTKKVVDESTGAITYMPSVPGQKLLNDLPYFFDEVFFMDRTKYEGKAYRYLMTEGDRTHIAKDRSGKLDAKEQPDLTHIFKKILPTKPKHKRNK